MIFFFFFFFFFFCRLWIFFKINFFKKKKKKKKNTKKQKTKKLYDYCQSVKQFRPRSGPTKRRAWPGSKLFAKIITRRLKSPLARKELTPSCWAKFICILFYYSSIVAEWMLCHPVVIRMSFLAPPGGLLEVRNWSRPVAAAPPLTLTTPPTRKQPALTASLPDIERRWVSCKHALRQCHFDVVYFMGTRHTAM